MIPLSKWAEIKRLFNKAFNSSLHYSIATINADGTPHVTPIGSLMLLDDNKGVYFEYFTRKLPVNFKTNPEVCVLAVNSGKWFWFKSLFKGKFISPPAIRLRGRAGIKRKATPEERALWEKRTRLTKWTKGHQILWKDMEDVREIEFDSVEAVKIGRMT